MLRVLSQGEFVVGIVGISVVGFVVGIDLISWSEVKGYCGRN